MKKKLGYTDAEKRWVIRQLLKYYHAQQPLGLRELGQRLGRLNASTIDGWLLGTRSPSTANVTVIINFLKIKLPKNLG